MIILLALKSITVTVVGITIERDVLVVLQYAGEILGFVFRTQTQTYLLEVVADRIEDTLLLAHDAPHFQL